MIAELEVQALDQGGPVTESAFASGSFSSVSGFRKWLVAMYDMTRAFAANECIENQTKRKTALRKPAIEEVASHIAALAWMGLRHLPKRPKLSI